MFIEVLQLPKKYSHSDKESQDNRKTESPFGLKEDFSTSALLTFGLDNSLSWGAPVHWKIFNSIPSLYPLDGVIAASFSSPSVTTNKNVSRQ